MTSFATTHTGRGILEAIRDGVLDPPPAAQLLRLQLEEVGEGRTVFTFRAEDSFANPNLVHGGVLAAIADFAVTTAIWTQAPAGADIVTSDLHVSYLRSVPLDGEVYRCHGSLQHLGRSQANASATVLSAAGETHVLALGTCRIRTHPTTV